METIAVVLNVRTEHVEAFEAGFREHELPVWRDLRERGLLERKIEELRGFERDYRSRLHTYIQGQLAELKRFGGDAYGDSTAQGEQAPAEAQQERHA